MVAIVTGAGLGTERSSANVLGSQGQLGSAGLGQGNDLVTINAANGNLVISHQDEVLIGRGPDAVVSRTYNSQGLFNDDNGDNWRLGIQRRLTSWSGTPNVAGATVTRIGADGTNVVYTYDTAKGVYVTTDGSGAHDTLRNVGHWIWTDGDTQVTEVYDIDGNLISQTDTDGNWVSYQYTWYNAAWRLARVQTTGGDYTDLGWTGGNLTSLTTSYTDTQTGTVKTLSRTRYAYDGSNRLIKVTVDLSPEDGSVVDGRVYETTYGYDSANRVNSIAQSDGTQVTFTYDGSGRVTAFTQAVDTGITRTTTLTYGGGYTSITDPQGNVTTQYYDTAGQLIRLDEPAPLPGGNPIITRFTYDANGNLELVAKFDGYTNFNNDSSGDRTYYRYDGNGNLADTYRLLPAQGFEVTRYSYGSANELLTETRYTGLDPDGWGGADPAGGMTTRYVYDAQKHLRFTIGAEGEVVEYVYSTAAGLTWKLISTIKYTAQTYDISGLGEAQSISETTMAAWAGALADRSTVERTDLTYDFRGNLSTTTSFTAADAAGVGLTSLPHTVTSFVYDQSGLLLSKQVSGRTGSEVYTYDGLGRMLTSTDFAGNLTTVAFDNGNRRTTITLANGSTVTTSLNARGQATDRTTAGAGAANQVESYRYDALGRLKTTVDALSTKDYTFYDATGRKTGYMDRIGNLTEYRYDAGDRLLATIEYATAISGANLSSLFDGSGNPLEVAFASVRPASAAGDLWNWNIYDAADRLTGTIAADGAVVQYVYDAAGRLVRTTSFVNRLAAATVSTYKTSLPASLTAPTASATDRTTRYFYDKSGRRIGALDADGALTRSVYDAAGRVLETVQYASLTTQGLRAAGTWAQLLSSVTGTANPADRHQYFAYDDQGNLRFTLDGKRNVTEIVYDDASRAIRTVAYDAPIGATSGSYSLAYIQGQIASLSLGSGPAVRTSRTTYDWAGRKAFAIDGEGYVTAYAYGALDQVVKVTRFATAFTAAGDQTLGAMQGWASGNANASDRVSRQVYDGLGRLVYEVDAEGYVTEHQYDQKNRLLKDIRYPAAQAVADSVTQASLAAQIGAVPAAAITTLYEYDANGNRTKVTDGEGFATRFTFDTFGRNTQITNLTTGVATQLVYDALDRVIQTTSAYGTAEALTVSSAYDGAGNLVSSTDARGSTTTYTYDAAGNRLTQTTPLSSGITATTSNQYDVFGNVTAVTDALGRTTVFAYDALDRVVAKTVPLHWDTTTSTTVTATTTYQYDAFDNLVAETDPRGVVTWYYYDRLDRLVYTVDGEGYATQNSYSIGSALTSVRRMATKPTGTGSATTRPTFIANNGIDGLTSFTRDKLDRVTRSTDAQGYHEDYALDAFGNRSSVTNKLGNTTTNLFDKRGLLKQETLPVASIRSDGSYQSFGVTNTFSYDSNGNRTQMVEAAGLSEQRTTTYVYDKHDRLIQKSIGSLTVLDPMTMALSSAAGAEYFSYDGNGNVIETKDANGSRTLSYYDLANRKIAEVSPAGTLSTWTHDANGNVLTARVYGDAVGLPSLPGGTPPSPFAANNYRETTFVYDFANRQVGTIVAGLTTGSYNGSSYTTSASAVTTATQYDKAGNIIAQTDGNGGKIHTFYDQLNRRIGQIDQAGYVTRWTLDHEGNVTQERRFATRYAGAVTPGGTLPLPAADAVNDRTTDFTYDRNGRRLTETRQNVKIATVAGGSIAESIAAATITYTYNGLGLVTSKQEATGDTTIYAYDEIGRQSRITGQSYTDYTGATVFNQQDINYDGLNNVTRTVENSARVTTYAYGAGGRLATSTDAAGNVTRYFYDAAGHVTATTYRLVRADGSAQYVGQSLLYDAAGRQLSQKTFTSANEVTWSQSGDTTDYFYDAYGQVIARGTNSGREIGNAQEFNHYDKAGRVWRTNFNDGVTKAYIYDANGNATLLLQSIGAANLKTGYADVNGMLADTAVSKTISVFDARNQLIDTIQSASNNAGASPVHAEQVNTPTGTGTVYFNSNASVSGNRVATGASASPVSVNNPVSAVMAGSTSVLATKNSNGLVHTIQVDRFNLPQNGGGNIHVVLENDTFYSDGYTSGVNHNSIELGSWSSNQFTIYLDNVEAMAGAAATPGFSYQRITVYQEAPAGGRLILAQTQENYYAGTYASGSLNGTTHSLPQIQLQNLNSSTAAVRVFGRPRSSSAPFAWMGTASQMVRADGSPIAGWFTIDASGMQGEMWDLQYYAFDSAGNLLDAKSAVYQPNSSVLIEMTGTYLTSAGMSESVGLFNANNLLLLSWSTYSQVASVEFLARPAGSGQGFLSIATTGVMHSDQGYGLSNDLAGFDMQGWNFWANNGVTAMDYQLVYRDPSGNHIATSSGVLTGSIYHQATYWETPAPVNGPGQAMTTWDGSQHKMLFTGFPVSTQNLRVFYRIAGTNGAFTQLAVTSSPRGGAYGQAGWWSGSPPVYGQTYEFWVEPLDANGAIIGGRSQGVHVFGSGLPPVSFAQYAAVPPTIYFQPPSGTPVTNQRMRYSSNGGASWSGWIDYGAGGVWTFNASALAPDFYTTYGYTVEYETYNNSTMVSRATGGVTLGYASQAPTLTNVQSIAAKVRFNPKQTGGAYIKLFYRQAGSTGAYSAATIARTDGIYAWDVDAANVRPQSGSIELEYYYDVYDASNNLMANLVGSDHVQGTLTISSDHYANTTGKEIQWVLDTASASQYLIHRRQTHNAFGEIDSETDGRGYTTTLTYNTEGKLIRKVAPQVTVTSEAGVDTVTNPTEYYHYDKSGRQVAQRDANGNLITQTLLAGSGYGGSQALVTAEYRPGSVTTRGYDNWGDERTVTDGLGAVTTKFYDANHNLIEVDHPIRTAGNSIGTQLKDYYAYDALGQRIKHWNSQLGAGVVETTDYDAMGRVTRTVSMGGQWTNYGYTYSSVAGGAIATAGLGNFGGWQTVTSTSAGGVHYQNKDLFGRVTAIYDFGGHHSLYTYDNAGRLVQQTNNGGQNVAFTYYENGYVKSITDNALQMRSTFEYDSNGNRTRETYNGIGANPVYYQNASITYDAMNRMTRFLDPKADIRYKYDAVGNRRNVRSDYQNGVGGGLQTQDYWYKYDGQNRFVTTMGTLSGGVITRGSQGVNITYDAAGNRATATYGYDNHTEAYTYTADGYLENASFNGVMRSRRTNDALGRVVQYTEYAANGVTATLSRWSSFDNDNRVTADTTNSLDGSVTTTVEQTYDYRAWNGSGYAGADQGVVTHTYAHQTQSNGAVRNTHTNYYYVWWDEAKQSSIIENASNPANPNSGQWAPGIASLSYDVNGHIAQAVDQNAPGGARITNYRNDAYGQVMVREQQQNGVLGARQLYCYFNGMRIGDVGNDGAAPNLVDYAQQLASRGQSRETGLFRHGRPVASADFDQNYQPINAGYPGAAASSYTVRTGDTLATIAQAVWGDAAMWYLIAEANGLASSSQLIAGQRLIIPNKVTNVHNNTGTFRVYNPGEAIGDTLPTLPNEPAPPPPPARKKGGCGGIGAILMAVVAVVVTIVALPAGAPTVMQGLLAGAAGAAAGQVAGLATGTINKFDFKAVALGAISGMVTAGIGQLGRLAQAGKLTGGLGKAATFLNNGGVASTVIRGALGGAATQGLGLATGLQGRFDWGGVAAAGVGAGISSQINLPGTQGRILSGTAGGLAASAAESLVTGQDFGDTLMANLPGIIGNTVGNAVAERVGGGGRPSTGNSPNDIVVNQDAIRDAGRGLLPEDTDLSFDNLLAQNIADSGARLQGRQMFALAGGDASLARSLLAGAYGPTMAEASQALIASGSTTFDATFSGGDLDGDNRPAVYGVIGDTWTNDLRSFGRYVTGPAGGDGVVPARWVENAAVMRRVGIARAEFNTELLRAGLAAVDIGVGGYNIATGDGGLRDYLAVGGLIPVGKALRAAGVTARMEAKSFASFVALKRYLGPPGAGNQWHHIVEQTPGNLKTFGAEMIHSTDNVIAIPVGTHVGKGSISAYYSGKDFFTNGQTVRQWLSTQSFQAQRQFGLDTLKRFGR